jgi:hypothetical protein
MQVMAVSEMPSSWVTDVRVFEASAAVTALQARRLANNMLANNMLESRLRA